MQAEASTYIASTTAWRIDRVAWLCGLVLLFEGYDIAAVGYAIPSLVDTWRIPAAAFTQVLTAGNVGLLLGSIVAGLLGDRFGRKPVLLTCVSAFGAFSLISASAHSLSSLEVLRFFTGLGLGGGLPTVLALASDFAPRTAPTRFVMLVNVGVPIGFSAGGLMATRLVHSFGWRAIFVVGGVLPIFFAPLLALWMQESLAPLGRNRGNLVSGLLQDGLAPKTLLLWSINALSYLSIYFMLLWTPALLHSKGVSASRAILATTIYGLGVIVGPVLIAFVADRFGLEPVLTWGLIFGALCILFVGLLQPRYWQLSLLLWGAGIGGGCQGGINSLSALSYPHSIRSRGAGWALGVGRLGTIAGPLLGGFLLSLDIGLGQIFIAASIPVFCAAVLLAFLGRLQRQIPG